MFLAVRLEQLRDERFSLYIQPARWLGLRALGRRLNLISKLTKNR